MQMSERERLTCSPKRTDVEYNVAAGLIRQDASWFSFTQSCPLFIFSQRSEKNKLGFVPRQTPIEKHGQKWVQKVHFSSEAFIYKALEESKRIKKWFTKKGLKK